MHRLRTLLHLVGPGQLRDAIRPRTASGTRSIALRCGTSIAAALLLAGLTGHVQLAGFAALGSLAALYGRLPGHRYRVSVTLLAGLALTGTVLLTAQAAASLPTGVVPLVIGTLAAAAQWSCQALRQGPPGSMIPVFAAGAAAAPVSAAGDVLARAGATAAGALIAVAVASVVAGWHHYRGLEPTTSWTDLRRAFQRPELLAPAALLGAGAALAGLAADGFGWGHPTWAALGAVAVLQGPHLRSMGVRAVQRGIGTIAGALLAVPLLHAGLDFWGVAACVVVLQVITELVVARHYGLAMLTITPMALLLSSLAVPTSPSALALDRAADTVLGVLVGLVVAVLLARPDAIAAVRPAATSPALATAQTTPDRR